MSEEYCLTMREAAKKRGVHPETMRKAHEACRGRKRTEQEIQRTREIWLGRSHTEEAKEKISAASKGRKRSSESIAKANRTRKARGVKTCGSPDNSKKGWITRKLNLEKKYLLLSMGLMQGVILDG